MTFIYPLTPVTVTGSAGGATEVTAQSIDTHLANLDARTAGSLAPVEHDEVVITYVPSGNGVGQIQTVTYKLATVTVKTLTLSYNADDKLSGVVAV